MIFVFPKKLRHEVGKRTVKGRFLDHCLPAISFEAFSSNILSKASIFAKVSPTAAWSAPSHLKAVMGPCNNLFTMDLLISSTAFICFFVSPSPKRLRALFISDDLISSAFPLKAYIWENVSYYNRACSSPPIGDNNVLYMMRRIWSENEDLGSQYQECGIKVFP